MHGQRARGRSRSKDVAWENGKAVAKGKRHGNRAALTLDELAAGSPNSGGPIAGHNEFVADGAGVSFASHICDVEVDPKTGATKVVRYTVIQDAGKAIHPDYVEGQFQGEPRRVSVGRSTKSMSTARTGGTECGFSRLPHTGVLGSTFIDTQILEIPNPNHPYGIRGVGETSIVPPLAAIGNAVSNAAGVRMNHVPMSPPRILKALKSKHV